MHLTSSSVDWYVLRASGIVAYVLLTAAVAVGIGLAGKERLERWPRFAVEDVHRFFGTLVGLFLGVHVLSLAIDAFLPFSVADIVVPFHAPYRPVWTGLGIVGVELLLALAVTNKLRNRIPYRFWRRAHYLNFAVWLAATAHGIGSGTDSGAGWSVLVYVLSIALVAGLVVRRIARARAGATRRLGPELLAAGAAGMVVTAVLVSVPLGAHGRVAKASSSRAIPASVTDTLTGSIVRQTGTARELVSLIGRGSGDRGLLVRVDLLVGSEVAESTSLQLEYLPGGATCTGRVTNIESYAFDGTCTLANGSTRTVHASWSGSGGAALRGTISAVA